MPRDAKKKIVIAEDDPAILELVTIRLELAGYHAIPCRDGHQALSKVFSMRPDAMILDIGLPGMDGFEVLAQLGKRVETMPVLMLTARHTEEDVKRALAMGAKGYLSKPFDDKALLYRIGRLLHQVPAPAPVCHIQQSP
jgi:two-component system OmpR family response regulator